MAIMSVWGRASRPSRLSEARQLQSSDCRPVCPEAFANDHRQTTKDELEFLDRYLLIGIDAHLACNLHGFFGNLARRKLRVLRQRLRRRLRIRPAAANRRNTAIRFDHVALP